LAANGNHFVGADKMIARGVAGLFTGRDTLFDCGRNCFFEVPAGSIH
jgi:hypothetical protein